jgi:hypothetical protein
MVEQRRLVNEDLFTCTIHGQPIHADANWLTQLLFYWLFSHGGMELLQLVNSLALTTTMGLLIWLCWRKSASLRLAAGLGMFTFLGVWQVLLIRPQTFSLLFFALMYALLEAAERRRWLLVFPPLLEALWVNVHGAFPVGVMLMGCYFAGALVQRLASRRRPTFSPPYEGGAGGEREGAAAEATPLSQGGEQRQPPLAGLLICLLATALATLANPYGLDIYGFVSATSGRSSARSIQEWVPAQSDSLIGITWVLSVLLALFSFGLAKPRLRATELCLASCFLPLSFTAVRMVAWWLLAIAPVIATQLAAALPRRLAVDEQGNRPSLIAGVFLSLFVLLAVACAPPMEHISPVPKALGRTHRVEHDLEQVAEFLRQHPTPNRCLYSRLEWGAYFTWSLAPDGYRVFLDSRIDLYPDDAWAAYLAILHARADWQAILDWHGVDCMVLDASHGDQREGLLREVQQSADWQLVDGLREVRVYVRRAAR